MTPRWELINAGAEAGWQDEAMRATGKPRFEEWREQSDATREKWRGTAEAILLRFEAHAGGCVVVPRHATADMQNAAERLLDFDGEVHQAQIWNAMHAKSPYAPEEKP